MARMAIFGGTCHSSLFCFGKAVLSAAGFINVRMRAAINLSCGVAEGLRRPSPVHHPINYLRRLRRPGERALIKDRLALPSTTWAAQANEMENGNLLGAACLPCRRGCRPHFAVCPSLPVSRSCGVGNATTLPGLAINRANKLCFLLPFGNRYHVAAPSLCNFGLPPQPRPPKTHVCKRMCLARQWDAREDASTAHRKHI